MLTLSFFFFFNVTATTKISPLSLPAALPISPRRAAHRPAPRPPTRPRPGGLRSSRARARPPPPTTAPSRRCPRSEEHTSELQSRQYLVCRLLLEKKKQINCDQYVKNKQILTS